MRAQPSRCPEAETIALLAEGHLPGSERADTVAHVSRCEACYAVLADAMAMETPPGDATPRWPSWARTIAAVLVVVLFGWWGRQFLAGTSEAPMAHPHTPVERLLASGAPASALAANLWPASRAMASSFAPGLEDRAALRLGALLADVEIAAAAGGAPLAEAVRKARDELTEGWSEVDRQRFEQAAAALATEGRGAMAAFSPFVRAAQQPLEDGRLLEACRVAALVRAMTFFNEPTVIGGIRSLRERTRDEAARGELGSIEAVLRNGAAEPSELAAAFGRLLQILS